MNSIWYEFLDEFKNEIPYRPLSVILEAFYWYHQMRGTDDIAFKASVKDKVNELMMK
jgi:hypothetical protein